MHLRDLNVKRRLVLPAYAAITGAAALVTAVALPAGGMGISTDHFWWIALVSTLVLGSLAMIAGLWTTTGVYASVFWCFHFGLIAILGYGLVRPDELSPWDQSWALGPFAADAALLALVGSLAFASGVAVVHVWRRPPVAPGPRAPLDGDAHSYGAPGSVLVFAAIAVWCSIVVATGGLPGFFNSYGEYLHATAEFSGVLSGVWFALGCGIVLAATGRAGWLRTGAIGAFTGLAVVALPLGLRGEIMFPSIAVLVGASRCGRGLSWRKASALVATLLLLIPLIREVRHAGLQGVSEVVLELRFFDAFLEMGGSLHPVEKVVRWQAEGEPFDRGSSYWAPIERAAARLLPGLVSTAAEDDMRIMNILVLDRVGAIGFSPVAEACRNFGPVGVVIVLGLLGAALASIDRIDDPRVATLVIATLYVPLLTNVRNSFISVPVHCVAGVLFILLVGAMRHVCGSVLCRPHARPAYIRSKV